MFSFGFYHFDFFEGKIKTTEILSLWNAYKLLELRIKVWFYKKCSFFVACSKDMLMSYLRYEGLSEAGFAAQEKQRLSLIQLETGIQASAFITKNQADEFLRISDQTRDFDQITLEPESFMQAVSLEDGVIEKYYQDKLRCNLP